MMFSGQKQEAGDNSTAIQAGNNVTINHGLSAKQMLEIMDTLGQKIQNYASDAQIIMEERLKKFQSEVIEKFSDPQKSRSEAFKDPDFQFLLRESQSSYVRDGSETTSNVLIELLSARSNVSQRNREALILNEACLKVNKLTDNDLIVLSSIFSLFYIRRSFSKYYEMVGYINFILEITQKIMDESQYSTAYLQSLGCLDISNMISRENKIIEDNSELFTNGFSAYEIKECLTPQSTLPLNMKMQSFISLCQNVNNIDSCVNGNNNFTINGENDPRFKNLKLRTLFSNKGLMIENIEKTILSDEEKKKVLSLIDSKKWEKGKIIEKFNEDMPILKDIEKKWPSNILQKCTLTSVGIALAHAYIMKNFPDMDAPLSIWLK